MIPIRQHSLRPKAFALAALIVVGGLAGCSADGTGSVSRFSQQAPSWAEPGTCWGRFNSPAVIETVTHQILTKPAELNPDGTVAQPAVYKTETRQEIVQERKYTWFETPCAEVMTPEFNASVQRALAARGFYDGPVNSEMDRATRAAVRTFQKPDGVDSDILSLASARKLGLVAIELDD
ncbi:peptidoglycan-binding domain-containing protein [Primorskyibacter sp. S87]|uniref:peptidoglycan-binding domain-containing protein n=1 Tax=Primorskyibacter sp. S87 TaxID=3415126 RepID=UPI003C7BB0C0